ncbi:MAG: transposase family protein [Prevotellaceae bacterium]|jgi:predicted transposase YbfD/YdcC|nr:transposase family protein [Prevotellaceae bacterium]
MFTQIVRILLIGLFTHLRKGEGYEDMALFAKTYREFLKSYTELPNGIPSYGIFCRALSRLEPDLFHRCLNDYGKDIIGLPTKKQIRLGSGTLKWVSLTSQGNTGLHIISAWISENHLHQHLDVTFRENACRAGKTTVPENFSILRKPTLQIIREQPDKISLRKRKLKVAYDLEHLKKLIT